MRINFEKTIFIIPTTIKVTKCTVTIYNSKNNKKSMKSKSQESVKSEIITHCILVMNKFNTCC